MRFLKNGFKKAAVSLLLSGSMLFAVSVPGAAMAKGPKEPDKPVVKNVIMMISDGCGYNQVDAASLYLYGRTGVQVYEHFPFKFGMSTYSADGHGYDPQLAWNDFDYVKSGATDSAAAATAMSTGVKTNDKAIGVDVYGNPLKHVAERAEELGKATGVVTSVQFSHATPAGFVAHNASRNNYEQIAQEMILSSATDIIMGCGNPEFNNNGEPVAPTSYKYVGGQTTWDGLKAGTVGADADGDGVADPWTLIQTRTDFQNLMNGPAPKRVCGVAQVYGTLQQSRGGNDKADPFAVPLNENVPTLAEMTGGALNVLDDDPDGFFLMIEGGAVDWASHANQSGRVIEEEIDFNRAAEAVVDWVKKNSNWGETLLLVTGDHETGYLTGPGSDPDWMPLVNNGAGNLPGMQWNSGSHTNSLIPFFAKGAAARFFKGCADGYDPVHRRYIDNTDIAGVIFKVME